MFSKIVSLFLNVNNAEASFDKRGFDRSNPERMLHLETVGYRFLDGYRKGLRIANKDVLAGVLNEEEGMYRGFAFEGMAMAKTMLEILGLIRKGYLKTFMGTSAGRDHIYMLHVGAGWAFARLRLDVEKRMIAFDPVLRWLIVDGYGFHEAYFKTKAIVDEKLLPRRLKDPYCIRVFYQGVGRALWFVHAGSATQISKAISAFDTSYRNDLWSGVGLACAYAGGVPNTEISQLRACAGNSYAHLAQGVVFAATARVTASIMQLHTEAACNIICKLSSTEAAALAAHSLNKTGRMPVPENRYEAWRSAIRMHFDKKTANEKIPKASAG
ncbi:MAG TPA: DUF1702 family protein [Flavisolibacter sp.]|nr:DUF1702 family protein [Flavisolibacter sp.]